MVVSFNTQYIAYSRLYNFTWYNSIICVSEIAADVTVWSTVTQPCIVSVLLNYFVHDPIR